MESRRRQRLPRGIPAASLKRQRGAPLHLPARCLPRGIPAASLKQRLRRRRRVPSGRSSAGNTRGLIEALSRPGAPPPRRRLPRGIPAASLKLVGLDRRRRGDRRLPRGIPAASLKHHGRGARCGAGRLSSAGNTRGLIEAAICRRPTSPPGRLPRGIPAASLKRLGPGRTSLRRFRSSAGNTRGLIEATASIARLRRRPQVFRGEYL